jgi:cytoskeletal protein RodZ
LLIGVGAVIVIVASVILFLFLRHPSQPGPDRTLTPSATPTPSPTPEPTPSDAPTAEPSESTEPADTPPPNSQTPFCQGLIALRPELEAAGNEMIGIDQITVLSEAKPPVDHLADLLTQVQNTNPPENLQAPLTESLDFLHQMSAAIDALDYATLDRLSKQETPASKLDHWQAEAEAYCTS